MSSAVTTDTTARRAMDVGRLVVVPFMVLLAWMNVETLFTAPNSARAVEAAAVVRGLLVVAFYLMIIGFYLVRRPATSTTSSVPARVLAVVATFMPFSPFLAQPVEDPPALLLPTVLLAAGMAWSLWSLRHLGRNLSIVAQARALTRSGPYRLVRHPLYLGELVATLGIVLAGFTWAALSVFAVLVALQLYRSVKEEQVLLEAFPEYADYRLTTARLVPGLF